MAKQPVLTPQGDDFPRWYQDVVAKAELAENGPPRGSMVIRPYAYAMWELMQADLDRRIKVTGAENVYFPALIPQSYISREAAHVEGFSHEFWTVTHGGGEELAEPMILRPTSETVFGEYMAKWVQSYRDLPLLLNQWANIFRWELRPRLFLRTTEFLWQEGHTVHASQADAAQYARRILDYVYAGFMEEVLAVPVLRGRKTARERFAGADNTMTCEAMMGDGKALQMGTSHELGQNFARVFDIKYLGDDGAQQLCWTTSWGVSTRMVGGLIMCHGDDAGLRLPPAIAPHQVVVLLVKDEGGAGDVARRLRDELVDAGVRVRLDDRVDTSFGRRAVDWELKGIPVRVEVGPRELAEGNVGVMRRDTGEREQVAVDKAVALATSLLAQIQVSLLETARARRDARTTDVSTVAEAVEAAQDGFARIPFAALGETGEDTLQESAITVRCIQREDGSVPDSEDEPDLVAFVARSY
ncbi:MAG TPA: proline--tRNA ligase [Acidimicrobiales bacterium]|nr:proline--tRNA ligase [Acidimicrobiales bacterium]